MEYIFILAERITFHLKNEFVKNKAALVFYSFDSCQINNTSFLIKFNNSENSKFINLMLNTHPLDIPWSVKVLIDEQEVKKYEINPNLLKQPETLGNNLAKKIANDTIAYIRKK